jgi:acyl carrier protein
MAKSIPEILGEMNAVFAQVLQRPVAALTEKTTAADVEGWDSLTHTALLSAVEAHFGVKFPIREVVRFQNVGDICRAVEARTKTAG